MLFALPFRRRVPVGAALALVAGLSGACGPELKPNELDWRVSFICEADRVEADTLMLRVLAGGCGSGGAALYEAKLARGAEPPAVDRIGSGSFGIEAIAYAEEQIVASTCVKVTLPRSEPIALKLRSPGCTVDTAEPVVAVDAATSVEPEADAEAAVDAETALDAGAMLDARVIDATSAGCASGCLGADACTDACVTCTRAADCDDRNPCTTDTCASGSCDHTNNNATCDDGNSCTSGDVCAAGQCAGVNLAKDPGDCGLCGRSCGSGASCQNGACKPGSASTCTAYRNAGHDYLVCTEALAWLAARDRCRSFGLVLVAIDSQSENDFLRDRLGGAPRWIGANDLGATGNNCRLSGEEGSWYWTSSTSDNGVLFCTAAVTGAVACSPVDGRYQNWHYGEPNNGCSGCTTGCGEGQDCASIDPPGTWDDDSCSSRFGYICETP